MSATTYPAGGIPYTPDLHSASLHNVRLNVRPRLDPRDYVDPHDLRSSLTPLPSSAIIAKMPPVLDQGQLGSCTANGYAGMYATALLNAGKSPVAISRLMLYFGERQMEGDIPQDAGADPRDGAKFMQQTGVAREDLWPYDITKFTQAPPQEAYADAPNQKISAYYQVAAPYTVKAYLAANIPVGIAMLVFNGMMRSRNGVIPMPMRGEQPLGGHWVFYRGYQDRPDWPGGGYFIIRNSWSASAGNGGDYYIPYLYDANPQLTQVRWRIAL